MKILDFSFFRNRVFIDYDYNNHYNKQDRTYQIVEALFQSFRRFKQWRGRLQGKEKVI